ncbi:hypothetical protein BH09MYX1_BH09MYX1_06030 [soil metagenome]
MKLKRLGRNTKGAVLAEFAFAFMPIATMFLFVCQFARFEMCRLASYHAANVAVRACAVTNVGGDGINPGGDDVNGPATDADKAAKAVLKSFTANGSELSAATVTCQHAGDQAGDDTVKLDMTYTCGVPVGKTLMCPGGSKNWTATASYPHQGALYRVKKP